MFLMALYSILLCSLLTFIISGSFVVVVSLVGGTGIEIRWIGGGKIIVVWTLPLKSPVYSATLTNSSHEIR